MAGTNRMRPTSVVTGPRRTPIEKLELIYALIAGPDKVTPSLLRLSRRNHNHQPGGTMYRKSTLLIATATAALTALTAGCGSTITIPAASVSATASTAAQAAPSPSATPDCTSQMVAWRDAGGGLAQLNAVSGDLGGISTAADALESALNSGSDASSAESSLQSAASSLQSDDAAAEGNLPPSCVPGLRSDEGEALTDYSKAAGDAQNAVSELGSGSYGVADGDLTASGAAEAKGTAKLRAAAAAITAYTNG